MIRGLVVGKFYPFHRGHKFLIETALAQVDELTVLVVENSAELIPGVLRASWIKETHPSALVLVISDINNDDDSHAWAVYTKKVLGFSPDRVFTSESYGDLYAHFLGARHIMVDKERRQVPISATKIRNDPLQWWEYLEPCVRAYYAKRVCVLGAESTGTTTMARALAEHYKTAWVPEFGRTYWEAKMSAEHASRWSTDEFIFIAQQQNALEDQMARICNKILICDTDAFTTGFWHERYRGYWDTTVEKVSVARKIDWYFVTNTDIPFVQDGTRDGEHIRQWMHERFVAELRRRGKPFSVLSGTHHQRMMHAMEVCDKLLPGH